MNFKKTFNNLVNNYNEEIATMFLLIQLGKDELNYEMSVLGADELTEEVFWTIAQDYAFYEDLISDENYELMIERGVGVETEEREYFVPDESSSPFDFD